MSASVGETYTCNPGTWVGSPTPQISYQWQRNSGSGFVPIANATAADYTIQSPDLGCQVRCAVTGTNSAGSATALSNAVIVGGAPVNTSPPVVTGTYEIGQTIHCDPGTWSADPAPTFAFQWESDVASNGVFSPLPGHTFQNYLIEAETDTDSLRVTVTATNSAGSGVATSAPVGPVGAAEPVSVSSDMSMMGVGV